MTQSIGTPFFWSIFLLTVIGLLALDLGIFHRKAHSVGLREAICWSIFWVVLSLCLGTYIYIHWGAQRGLEFFTGYLLEKAMSVDNIFVFVLIFSYFSVPEHLHHRILFWGILGALVMRALFIFGGAVLIQTFHWVLYLFGAFLIYTGVKILRHGGAEVQPERNLMVRLFQRFVPMVSGYEHNGFFVRVKGKTWATPLALVLVTVETTDLVFAVDSIPAIFGVTRDPFIVYTSNVCAILGLRAMYFMLAAVLDRFSYLGAGLGFVLMFIGAKMLLNDAYQISVTISLVVIGVILGIAVIASLLRSRREGANASNRADSLIKSDCE